ncbi:MAG TPA: hypothetical protein VMU09_04300 [Acidimicrobiales bacterium]|nr:hypothetical protein [Acidimicrobiales bacterium]
MPQFPSTRGRAHTNVSLSERPRPARRRLSLALALASPVLLAASVMVMVSGLSPTSAGATVHTSTVLATEPVPHVLPATTTTAPPPPTTTTAPPPPPTTTTTTTTAPHPAPAPAPAPAPVSSSGVPLEGQATAYGCGPALAYLAAYSAPGFQLVCPGDSQGHQATTCISSYPCAPGQKMIIITVPCAAAYMNEAHNSWAVQDGGTIDPYGYCH